MYTIYGLPCKSPCDVEMEERTHQDILGSVKECLQHRQYHAQPEEGLRQTSAGASRPDLQAEFWDQMHAMYDHYKDLTEGSCEEHLAVVCNAYCWALVAAALLEDMIERLSHSLSCGCQHSRSHKHLESCHQRSWAGSHQSAAPQVEVCQGGSSKRWAQSPSPGQSRRHITFEDDFDEDTGAREPCPLAWGDMEETRMEKEDLGACLPSTLTWKVFWLELRGRQPQAGPATWALPQQQCQVGQVEIKAVGHPNMVVGALRHPQPEQH